MKVSSVGAGGLHGCRPGEYKVLWGSKQGGVDAGLKSTDYLVGQGGWYLLPPLAVLSAGLRICPFYARSRDLVFVRYRKQSKSKNTPTVLRTWGYYSTARLQLVMLCCSHLLPPVPPPARPSPPHPSAVWHCWSVRGTASPWRWSMLAPQANNPSFFNMAGAQGQRRRSGFFFFFFFWSK